MVWKCEKKWENINKIRILENMKLEILGKLEVWENVKDM